MTPKGYGGVATIFNEGENNQNNIIVGENNMNYAIIREEQGGSPETSPAPSSGTCTIYDDSLLVDYDWCANCVFVDGNSACECDGSAGEVVCAADVEFLVAEVFGSSCDASSSCVATSGSFGDLYCCPYNGAFGGL